VAAIFEVGVEAAWSLNWGGSSVGRRQRASRAPWPSGSLQSKRNGIIRWSRQHLEPRSPPRDL